MEELRRKAEYHGATEFGKSNVKGKRFYVIYNNKKINFGSDVGRTYYDHRDGAKRKAWLARHSQIRNKQGQKVINLKTSPSWWARVLLW